MHPFDEHPRHLRLHDRIADRFNCISLRNTVHIRTRNYILGVRSRRFRYGSLCTWSYFDRILIVFRIDQAFLKYDRAEMAFAWRIIREYIRAFKTWRILSSYIEPFDRGSKRLGVHSFGFENIFIHTKCTKFFFYRISYPLFSIDLKEGTAFLSTNYARTIDLHSSKAVARAHRRLFSRLIVKNAKRRNVWDEEEKGNHWLV